MDEDEGRGLPGNGDSDNDFTGKDLLFSLFCWAIAIAAVAGVVVWLLMGHTQ